MIELIFLFIVFLCWGSFLNVVAYRLTYDKPFFAKRSYCPDCGSTIAWYDNIPLVSWILLGRKCRACKQPISFLYPMTELLSGIIFTALFYKLYHDFSMAGVLNKPYFIGHFLVYFLFFSALIVATRTDLQEMIILQLFSFWLMPVGFLCSLAGLTYVTWVGSLLGIVLGYGTLWLVGAVFKFIKKREGIGVGDMELLGMIGAFLGPIAVWIALLIASISGLLVGGGYLFFNKKCRYTHIPFGPFIVLGATLYFFFQKDILYFLLK